MSEPDSLFLRVRLSKDAYERYMASTVADARDFSDWMNWLDAASMCGPGIAPDKIDEIGRSACKHSVAEEIDAWTADSWAMGRSVYDAETETWRFAILQFSENYYEYLARLPPLRAVCRFKDRPGVDFILVHSYLWSEDDYTVLFELEEGGSTISGSPGLGAPFPQRYAEEASAFLRNLIPS